MSNKVVHGSNTYHVSVSPPSKVGLIVIQEWWGVTPHILKMVQTMSDSLQCTALTPDLYEGKIAVKPDEAMHLYSNLDWPKSLQSIIQGAKYLRSIGCEKVGVVGFCMGGALTIAACVKGDSVIDSGVSFYGIPPLELADAANLKIPMQFHFGNNDHSKGDKEAADGLKAKLVENKVDVSEFYQYEGADHAFMNEDEPHFKFNEAIAKQAMAHTLRFFRKTLKKE